MRQGSGSAGLPPLYRRIADTPNVLQKLEDDQLVAQLHLPCQQDLPRYQRRFHKRNQCPAEGWIFQEYLVALEVASFFEELTIC